MTILKESPDKEFFEKAFNLYYERVVIYTFHYCKDRYVAENLAQDTFIVLWENLSTIDQSKTPLPYLLFVAKNKTINYLNRETVKNKHKNHLLVQEQILSLKALECSTITDIQFREIENLVQKSMAEMSQKTKTSFQMSRYECKKNEEIASILGVSVKTVEYRIMSALRILRKNLKDYFPGRKNEN